MAIVDDEVALCEVFRRALELKGIAVSCVAHDGFEAVLMFKDHNPRPSIILMDYRLPGMNGLDAMREIKRLDPATKFIFISADDTVEKEALEAGVDRFIHKPASIRTIIEAVEILRGMMQEADPAGDSRTG